MNDLNRTMFYKVKFTVQAEPGVDALWQVLMSLRYWVNGKAMRDGYTLPNTNAAWSAVKAGGIMRAEGAEVELYSCVHYAGNVHTWACSFIERPCAPEGEAPRAWFTEVGFTGETFERGTVSIVLSYSDMPGFLGKLQPEPSPSIPRLVKLLLTNRTLACTRDGRPVQAGPEVLTPERFEDVFAFITDPERTTPVIYLSPSSNRGEAICLLDPEEVYDHVGPNAFIYHADSLEAAATFDELLTSANLSCTGGAIRVFAPRPNAANPNDHARHRFLSPGFLRENGQEGSLAVLRRALAQDIHFWQTMTRLDDVKRLNRESSRQKHLEEVKRNLRAHYEDDVLEQMIAAEEENDALLRELDDALDENQALKEENYALEARCSAYEAAFGKGTGTKGGQDELAELLRGMKKPFANVREMAQAMVLLYPDRLDFTERGWESLDDCNTQPATFWSALSDICTILQPLFAKDASTDICSEFDARSIFTYARGEGMMTRKSNRMMALRQDTYQGRPISIEPHVKTKNGRENDPRFVRIYLAFDEATKRVVIGDCGGHMENYSTMKQH